MTQNEKTFKGDDRYPEGEFDAGSINEALTIEEISEKYTVRELRDILRKNGLSVSGKKADLVERVLPILNNDLNETSSEDVSDDDLNETFPEDLSDDEPISSTLTAYGINYDDLVIKDKSIMKDIAELNIEGFTQNGLIMSDSTISVVSSDSSNIDLKMKIPEVSYSDFESTVFTFKNLDLSILPSSNPQSLELSALMDSLEIITERDYVNLQGLNLFSKSYPDNGIRLDIDINSFFYPNFYNATINFEDLDFNMEIGVDGQKLALSVNLPSLKLINKDYRVILSDLTLNILVHDYKLSDFDLSILLSDFHYTNYDDVYVNMDNVNVSLEPVLNSNSFDINIGMDSFDVGGITFNDLFPMLNIDSINIKAPADDSQFPINMTGHISPLDVSKIDLITIGALLSSGFDMDTYARNMSSLYEGFDIDASGFDIGSIFKNFDYSSLDSIVLNLSGLIDSAGIDLADFGIDLSDYDLSAINLPDIIDALSNSDFTMGGIKSILKLFTFDSDELDMSGLISFDIDNFDISSLLSSLNISGEDISGIADMLENSDLDLAAIFKNSDLSCLDSIVLNLDGLLDSLGIDLAVLADLGIDLSDYDLSAIKLSELMAIVNNFDIDKSTITNVLKLLGGLNLSEIDLSNLIVSFDADNFDLSSLVGSLDLSALDIAGIAEMLENSDLDLGKIFENFDWSCLDAIVLDLSGLIDSLGIDLAVLANFGIDLSAYDLSAIRVSEIVGILNGFDLDLSTIISVLKLFGIDLSEIDVSGLIVDFDLDKFDVSTLISSLNLSLEDISGIFEMFNNSNLDLAAVFENCDYSCLDAIVLDLSGLIDSLGIDLAVLANFGIDLSAYDLSAIKVSDLLGILNSFDLDMSTITAALKLLGLDLSDLDLSGLIASFDVDNFDLSTLVNSLDLSGLDISAIADMFNNSGIDLGGVFKDCDYSCLGAIELDLSGLIDSLGIDLSGLGIDLSGFDLSAIKLSDLIAFLNNSDINLSDFASMFVSENKPITLGDGVTDFNERYYQVDCNVADVNFNESTGKWEYQGLELKYYNKNKHNGKLSKKELKAHNDKCKNNSSSIDLSGIDLSGLIASFDVDNFDISSLLGSLDLSEIDISAIADMFSNSGIDFAGVFENCDYSCLGAIELDLSGLVDSLGVDLADLGIDLSGFDLSAIKVSDLVGILNSFDLDMSTITAVLKLLGLKSDDFDLAGLIASFDVDNFDMSTLLGSLDLSDLDISAIADMLENSDLDLGKIFENCDLSCLDAIVLDLSGLIDSLGIDLAVLADLGIDLSAYDLSAIKVSHLVGILNSFDLDMSIIIAVLKLFGIDLSEIDLSGLLASFDADKFDMSSLFSSLDLSSLDLSSLADIFNNLAGVFKNCDYSCLGAIVLDLSGLIDSLGIDLAVLADLGIDLSAYDLSAISLSDLIALLSNIGLDMSIIASVLKLFGLDLSDLDLSGLIASFDADNFDMSSLFSSLDLSGLEFSGIADIFNNLNIDFESIFENFDYSCLDAIKLDLSGLADSDINLADLDIDVSAYDLSAISLSDIIDVLKNSDFIQSAMTAMLNLFSLDWNELDMSGLIVSFDVDELDIYELLTSLNVPGIDIQGILDMLNEKGIDLSEFLKEFLGVFMEKTVPGLTQ